MLRTSWTAATSQSVRSPFRALHGQYAVTRFDFGNPIALCTPIEVVDTVAQQADGRVGTTARPVRPMWEALRVVHLTEQLHDRDGRQDNQTTTATGEAISTVVACYHGRRGWRVFVNVKKRMNDRLELFAASVDAILTKCFECFRGSVRDSKPRRLLVHAAVEW